MPPLSTSRLAIVLHPEWWICVNLHYIWDEVPAHRWYRRSGASRRQRRWYISYFYDEDLRSPAQHVVRGQLAAACWSHKGRSRPISGSAAIRLKLGRRWFQVHTTIHLHFGQIPTLTLAVNIEYFTYSSSQFLPYSPSLFFQDHWRQGYYHSCLVLGILQENLQIHLLYVSWSSLVKLNLLNKWRVRIPPRLRASI